METREIQTIETFCDLMEWISYCWDYGYKLERDGDTFILNKLYIDRTQLRYKTEWVNMGPGVFEDLEQFYELINKGKPSAITKD